MRSLKRYLAVLFAALSLAGTLSGCSLNLAASPEDLYALPQLPAEYAGLNNSIRQLIEAGAEYAAPTAGTNLQPLQLVDLDGDGQEEALAFLRRGSDERALKIYIYERTEQGYAQSAVIEGSGTAVYSVDYRDLDGDGRQEILVSWKVGPEMQVLSVFTIHLGTPRELMNGGYIRYAAADLDGCGREEILIFRTDEQGAGTADYYAWTDDGTLVPAGVARLSMTMAELSAGQVLSGTLRGSVPAVFATGVSDSRIQVTDVLALRQGELGNLTVSNSTGVSREIYRYMGLFPTDIDGDGVTELPVPEDLLSSGDADPCCRINWRSYDAAGVGITALSTYHALADGWYLELPENWGKALSVRTEGAGTDVSMASFGFGSGEDRTEVLRIYTFSGENRETLAAKGGRILLSREGDTIYAAELLGGSASALTEDALRQRFHRITRVWNLGGN